MARPRKTTASDNTEMVKGIDASLEEYRAIGSNATARFRDLSNLYTNMSGIPEFTQEDFNAFRPGGRIPTDFPGIIRECNYAYENNGLIWNVINLMTDLDRKSVV